ncbi:MAG: DoxX family membrane protein [Acidobacteriota bacterium]
MRFSAGGWRVGGLGLVLGLGALEASAHVKWFSDFDYATPPLRIAEVASPTFFSLLAVGTFVMVGLVFVDRRLGDSPWFQVVSDWLGNRQGASLSVMRLAMSALLLLSWSSDAVLAPELGSDSPWLVWLQFVVALSLLFLRGVALGGVGIALIFLGAVVEFGLFHMLDYLHYLGISVYLISSRSKRNNLRALGLPALYASMGFSLVWLGYEKLFYPSWALYLLEQTPQLALGFPPDFFLQAAAFVEIGLGFLLLIGLLERPLAAVITLVFFATTLVFGKVEVIGHTPLHAALVVFLLNGAGTLYKPPIAIHKKLALRCTFAGVNFVVITVLIGLAYSWSAHRQFEDAAAATERHSVGAIALDDSPSPPSFTSLEVVEEAPGHFDLHVGIDNWTFTPEKNGQASIANEGHGHVFVDGRKVGRLYGPWFHLGALEPGSHHVEVTLNGSDHSDFTLGGEVIRGEVTVEVQDAR